MKLKYILPVATIASVATIVAPIATSCSNNTFNLDKFENFKGLSSEYALKNYKPINITKDKEYTANVDLKNWGHESAFEDDDPINWFAFIADDVQLDGDELEKSLQIDDAKITINGKQLSKHTGGEGQIRPDEFVIHHFDKPTEGVSVWTIWAETELTKNDKLKIVLKAGETKAEQNIYFQIMEK